MNKIRVVQKEYTTMFDGQTPEKWKCWVVEWDGLVVDAAANKPDAEKKADELSTAIAAGKTVWK